MAGKGGKNRYLIYNLIGIRFTIPKIFSSVPNAPMSPAPVKLLIATNNTGKLKEFENMLMGLPFQLLSLANFTNVSGVAETGATFSENARLKAVGYAGQTGVTTLADDSGLEIQALGGRPGINSARYGGPDIDFGSKMDMLLSELAGTSNSQRKARFVCAIAISDGRGRILFEAEGVCTGRIAENRRGDGGFGYDPIFLPDGHEKTFGELPAQIKSEISHRAHAFRVIIPFLRHFAAN